MKNLKFKKNVLKFKIKLRIKNNKFDIMKYYNI